MIKVRAYHNLFLAKKVDVLILNSKYTVHFLKMD